VTNTELDDILRLVYPEALSGKDLKKGGLRQFSSILNNILIDYKKFQSYIEEKLAKH
jgi:hypothetical protein